MSKLLTSCFVGVDFNATVPELAFTSGQGIDDTACTQVQIFSDAIAEPEESFEIVLVSNELALAVPPNVSTIVIGKSTTVMKQCTTCTWMKVDAFYLRYI